MNPENPKNPNFSIEKTLEEIEQEYAALEPDLDELEQLEQERLEDERLEREFLEMERRDQELEQLDQERERELEQRQLEEEERERERELAEQIEREYLSPDSISGIGRLVVRRNIQAPFTIVDGEDEETFWKRRIHPELNEVRDQLSELDEGQRQHINEVIGEQPASAWMDKKLGMPEEASVKPYIERLLAKDNKGQYIVGDRLLMNFLELHSKQLAEEQEKLDGRSPELKASYETDLKVAVDAGWVQEEVLGHLGRLQEDTRLIADDGFETSVYGIFGSAGPTIDWQKEVVNGHKVRVAPKEIADPKRLKKLLQHEFSHITEGKDEPGGKDILGIAVSEAGLKRVIDDPGGEVLYEAVVEQFADTLAKGEPDETDPKSNIRKGATYSAPRRLLHVLVNEGVKQINIRNFFKAQFEDGSEAEAAGDASYQARLIKALDQAFPFTDVREEIANLRIDDEKGIWDYALDLEKRANEYKLSLNEQSGNN